MLPLFFGVAANALWGTAFVVPCLLHDFSPEIISISRYAIYGIISIVVFLLLGRAGRKLSTREFLMGNLISFCGNLGYYIFLAIGIKNSGFLYPALIIGLLPSAVILVGNIQAREIPLTRLLPGIGLVIFGVVLVNFFGQTSSIGNLVKTNHVLGVASSLIALLLLTIYCIVNANYLRKNPHISSSHWTSILGICALMHSIFLALVILFTTGRDPFALREVPEAKFWELMAGAIFLGAFVSYLAMWMWNVASRNITSVTAGKILCLETLFALAYGYAVDFRLPRLAELMGVFLVILGVYFIQEKAAANCPEATN